MKRLFRKKVYRLKVIPSWERIVRRASAVERWELREKGKHEA